MKSVDAPAGDVNGAAPVSSASLSPPSLPRAGRSQASRASTVALVKLLRYLWAAPASAVGATVALVGAPLGTRCAWHAGVLEVSLIGRHGTANSHRHSLPFTAITLGHVVVAVSKEEHVRLRAHERAHVAQYERWGPLLLLAYPAESLLQLLLGRRPYQDNRFEVQARRVAAAQAPRCRQP